MGFSRGSQQRLYFLPLPQGQGALRPNLLMTKSCSSPSKECNPEPLRIGIGRALSPKTPFSGGLDNQPRQKLEVQPELV